MTAEVEVGETGGNKPTTPGIVKTVEVNSEITKEHYDLSWTIENFNMVPFIREHPLYGPSIRLGKKQDSTWQLLLCKELDEDDEVPSLGFKLLKTEDNDVWDVCRYDIVVRSKNGDIKMMVIENELTNGEEDIPYIFVKGASEEEECENDENQPNSLNVSNGKGGDPEIEKSLQALFKEEVLVVECDIRYTYMPYDLEEPLLERRERFVVEDMKRLFKSQKYTDIVLRAGTREFPSHKSILCARSIGFSKLFEEDDGIEELDLEDVSESVAEMMLTYIYTGELPEAITATDCYGLFKASVKYAIKSLKYLCVTELKAMARDEPLCDDCDTEETTYGKIVTLELLELKDDLKEKFASSTSPSGKCFSSRSSPPGKFLGKTSPSGKSPRVSPGKSTKVSKSSPVLKKN